MLHWNSPAWFIKNNTAEAVFCIKATGSSQKDLRVYICGVKKAGVFLVLLMLLVDNLSMGQVCKLPVLVKHLAEHQQRDNRVTFWDFMSMHYWGQDIDDDDQDTDMKLPFKNFSNTSVQPLFCPVSKVFTLRTVSYSHKNAFQPIKEQFLPDPILSSLFRPPIVWGFIPFASVNSCKVAPVAHVIFLEPTAGMLWSIVVSLTSTASRNQLAQFVWLNSLSGFSGTTSKQAVSLLPNANTQPMAIMQLLAKAPERKD